MEEILYICKGNGCSVICKQNHPGIPYPCRNIAVFEESTKYQITKKPDPGNYLDIPEDLLESIEELLCIANEKPVKLLKQHGTGLATIGFNLVNGQECSRVVMRSWIKEKPAEPTVEELQTRLDAIKVHIKGNACVNHRVILDLCDGE